MKNADEIQRKINERKAKVYTASEFKDLICSNKKISADDVDVITCGTFGIMSGTMAVLSIPVCDVNVFKKADSITLNGIPATPGPCPNESLGVVDCTVCGTSKRDGNYGGGHLFKDMVAGLDINVKVTSDGKIIENTVRMTDIPYARMILTRSAFRNYTCFVNCSDAKINTIFSGPAGFERSLSMATVSGCGEINPIQNDMSLRSLNEGARILINGSPGTIMGTGTRSSPARANLSAYADMKLMDANMMGGFVTSAGPECMTSVAAAVLVTDETSLKGVSTLDENIELPIADVSDRIPLEKARYSDVWKDTYACDITKLDDCTLCEKCSADAMCPVGARPSTRCEDNKKCTKCGACSLTCVHERFDSRLGTIDFRGTDIPIALRQSDRSRGEELCVRLKKMITDGKWKLRV